MMKRLSAFCLLMVITCSVSAQKKRNPYLKQTTSEAGIVLSTNGRLSAVSLSALQYWQVGRRKQSAYKIGLGGRLTSSFGGK
ncbi:hypothetical protein EMGBS15_16650 [Filimonas sp.]|nr:hypothetical protein EMGBS15_16650 [Filimonas sp.]